MIILNLPFLNGMVLQLLLCLFLAGNGEAAVRLVIPKVGVSPGASSSEAVSGLAPHPDGLALLRSERVRNRPVRTVAVVGKARQGKSFFLSFVLLPCSSTVNLI